MSVHTGANWLLRLALVYFLSPSDFGLLGMATAVVALVQGYVDVGLKHALIQRKSSSLSEPHYYTAFWLFLGTSWAGAIVVSFVLAPLASWFYKEPMLFGVCAALSLPLVWSPFVLVQTAKLTKTLRFRSLFVAKMSGTILAAVVSIWMAGAGYGVWSLVVQTVLSSAASAAVVWRMIPWLPRLIWSMQAARDVLSFGMRDILGKMMGFFDYQAGALILGYFFSPAIVGAFVLASALSLKIMSTAGRTFKSVMFPFFSAIQDRPDRIKQYYLMQIRLVSLVVVPIVSGLALFVDELVFLVPAKGWTEAVVPMRYLAGFVFISSIMGSPPTVYRSLGKMDSFLKATFLKYMVVRTPMIIIGAVLNGFSGYLQGFVLSQIIVFAIDLYYLHRFIGLNVPAILWAIRELPPFLFITVGVSIVVNLGAECFGRSSLWLEIGVWFLAYAVLFRIVVRELSTHLHARKKQQSTAAPQGAGSAG
jgi:O-antigen/teichoic acid export membrane protein